jgi:hypothetical protein
LFAIHFAELFLRLMTAMSTPAGMAGMLNQSSRFSSEVTPCANLSGAAAIRGWLRFVS